MRRGRKWGRPEVAREGSEGLPRAGCASRCPHPWEVCVFPALGIWDNFVQPFVVFPGNCWLQPVTDRGDQGQRARGWRHLVGGARRVLGRPSLHPPPGGFCCKVGAQPRASPSHPTSQVIPNILLYLHGVPCPPCAAISRGGSGSRQGSGHHDTSHDSAAVPGSGSGRGSREPRCSHAAASACAQCPPCARPSFWACHHGHSAREHNRVLTKADFHPHLLRPRGFSAAGRRCQS